MTCSSLSLCPPSRTTVDSGVIVSVSTKQQLGKGEVLHRTAPAYPSADGSVVWGQSLLIDTFEPWDKFVLTIDLHPSPNLQQRHKVRTYLGNSFSPSFPNVCL
jgi:hypothetical protein